MGKRCMLASLLLCLLIVGAGCASGQAKAPATPTATPRPTFTEVPPASPTPTAVPTKPPTATPVPPTATPVPPTATPKPTATPVPPTRTPVPPTSTPAPQPGAHGVIGRLRTREARSDYGVNEEVFFTFEVENPTDADVRFGILGLKADKDVPFQTSWTSDVYDHKFKANDTFRNDDRIIFTAPGTYTVRLAICFASYGDCRAGADAWEEFGSVVVNIR